MIPYKAEDKLRACAPEEVRFLGAIGDKFQKVIERRMTSEYAQNVAFREAEDAFLHCADDAKAPIGIWQGEFWGKLILSACRGCRYTGDEKLKEFIRTSVTRVLRFQRPDGYLGTYRNERHVFPPDPKETAKTFGWGCNWTWNIWCRKYTLWALLEAYELLGDRAILDAAAASARQLIDMLGDMGAKIGETGTFFGLPSCSILKPILILYRHTGEEKFLGFALEIAREWESDDVLCAKIIKNSLAGIPVHLWNESIGEIPVVSRGNPFRPDGAPAMEADFISAPQISGKVYEMLSCFDGLLELYRVTGVKKYLTATEKFYDLILHYEYNTIFSVGFNDLFLFAASNPNAISEMCDVLHFMRLSSELYKLTGEPRYMDTFELAFYNPFLAGVARDGSWAARGVRASEGHMYAMKQAEFEHNHCCTDNMPRGFINAAEMIAASTVDAVYVNLYNPAQLTLHPMSGETVGICIGEGYLSRCRTTLTVDAALHGDKKLCLRIPAWSRRTAVRVNGAESAAQAGSFFVCPLKNGRTEIEITFDASPRLLENRFDFDYYPITPYKLRRYFSGAGAPESEVHADTVITENKARLCVGPLLLAASRELGSTKEEIFDHPTVFGRRTVCTVQPKEIDGFLATYDVRFNFPDGTSLALPMGDFASASDEMRHMDYRYTIFL